MKTINVTLNHKKTIKVPAGRTIKEIIREAMPKGRYTPYLVVRNDTFTSYNEIVNEPTSISVLHHFHESSHRAYESAAIMILKYVVENLFPEQSLIVMHSMCDGVFCRFENEDFCTPLVILQISAAFLRVVEENHSIDPVLISRSDARRYFTDMGRMDTVELLRYCESNFITLYQIDGMRHWTLSPPAPETGLIKIFDIKP